MSQLVKCSTWKKRETRARSRHYFHFWNHGRWLWRRCSGQRANHTYLCHNCLKFGHNQARCTSANRCIKCGDKHIDVNECPIKGDPIKCVNCKGDHPASSNSCPELLRQREIKRTMALENVSFAQAAKMVPQIKKSFSEVVSSQSINPQPLFSKNKPPNQNKNLQPILDLVKLTNKQ